MGFLDRAKEAASRAKSQARVAREQGQQRIEDLQARRQAELLLREIGLAAHEEHRGEGGHEAVVRALARLDEHLRTHPLDLSTTGLRGYVRTATGGGADDTAAPADRRATGQEDEKAGAETSEPGGAEAGADAGPKAKKESGGSASTDEKSAPSTPSMATGAGSATRASTTEKATTKKTTAKKSTAKKAAAKKTAAKKTTQRKTADKPDDQESSAS